MRVAYVCLQATREGQASHAHVWGIIRSLRASGWTCDLYEPRWTDGASLPLRAVRIALAQIRALKGIRSADVVYVRDHPLAGFSMRMARVFGTPAILEINGRFDEIFMQHPVSRRIRGWVTSSARSRVRNAAGVIAVTAWLAEWAREVDPTTPCAVIPNGADTERFRPDAVGHIVPDGPYAVYVGVLAEWQGIDTLIGTVGHAFWPEGVQLVIAGAGPLEEQVRDAAAAGHVDYLGSIPYADVPGLLANALVSLSPKNRLLGNAGYSPIKLYESMACGLPVLVSDFPGLAETVREADCGVVLPSDDVAAWAREVRSLSLNEEERMRMGENGRESAVRDHSWDCRAKATREFIEGVT